MKNGIEISSNERLKFLSEEQIDILKIGFSDRLGILWGWWWRSTIVSIIAMLIAFIIVLPFGIFTGIILTLMGIDTQYYHLLFKIICGIIGVLISIYSITYFIKWLSNSNIGKYRFILIKKY